MAALDAALRTGIARLTLRLAAALSPPAPPPSHPATAMGISFANPLGLAAGFDRNGSMVAKLSFCGFGFAEVGTVRLGSGRASAMARALRHLARLPRPTLPVGINIASRAGLRDAEALAEYRTLMRALWRHADYLVANLTAPPAASRRDADIGEYAAFITALCRARDDLAAESGRRVPLAIKLRLAPGLPLRALERLAKLGIDGVVGIGANETIIEAAAQSLAPAALISVGGVRDAADIAARLARGAALVQMHTAFARGGPFFPRRVLAELGTMRPQAAAEPT